MICAILDLLCNTTAAGTWDGDKCLVLHGFPAYMDAQGRCDRDYVDVAA